MVAVFGATSVVAAGCSSDERRRVDVFAASSLTDVFGQIERSVEAEHDDLDVVVSTGGSSSLAAQIIDGAPADVFAAADARTMQLVVDAGVASDEPAVFALNELAIAVEPGNPLGIGGLADLADTSLTLVVAAPEVPAGSYASAAFDAAGLAISPASYEQSVRSVASKVALGEADAGIVYRTDVAARGDELDAVDVEDAYQVTAVYPIVRLESADTGASIVLDAVLGDVGRAALAEAGFMLP
jgi:molybdate transport system substrate-binding protein